MKILILANSDLGLYKFRRELIIKLLENNQVYIALPKGDYVDELCNMGCNFINVELSRHGVNPFKELKLMKNYKKIMKEIKPDYVLTYTIKPNIYGGFSAKKLKIPYITNITGLGTAVEKKGLLQKITVTLYKKALKKAKMVFFQNEENKSFMVNNKIVKDNYDLLPGSGVNVNQYTLLDYPKDSEINFVFVARIMKEKGIDQYLDAAKAIKEKYPNTNFYICGFCEENYVELLKELQEKGIINYLGLVKNMVEIYEKCHCVVHPTYYPEGLSNVLLEASACGRPIITTNRSGCREVIDDGQNGYLVNQKDSVDLISKIEKFIELSYDDKKNMGIKGRRKVENDFNREIVINKYLNLIK